MNKLMKLIVLAMMSVTMIGCGAIDTNNAGVRISWDNQVKPATVEPGFYTAVISSVEEWVGKEIMIELNDMTPKAGDNLSMEDLDVEIWYITDVVSHGPMLKPKYANAHRYVDGYVFPAYGLVKSQGREAVY